MAETEYSGKDVGDGFDVVLPAFSVCSRVRGTSLGCEPDRFLDGEGREVDVVLRRVLDVTAIISGDLLGGQGVVVDIALNFVVGIALVCEHLEERRASGAWTTQHD